MKQRLRVRETPLSFVLHVLTAPIIYSLIIPFVILDVFVEIYQHLCFPIYQIPIVKRSRYIRIDRNKLSYLSGIEKIHCMYCGYCNGLLHYVTVISGETEKYWCNIEHQSEGGFVVPDHHKDFLPRTEQALDAYLESHSDSKNP